VRVPGTPFLMAMIYTGENGGYSSLVGFSSSGNSSTVHNYVFLDLTDRSFRRLIPTNDSYIRQAEQLPEAGDGSPAVMTERDGRVVQWWLFDVVTQDTNRDGRLDAGDLGTLAVSDAGGRGYTELIGGVREVYGRALRDANTLVVVYESGGTKRFSVIDLPGRAVTSTEALPDLGPDVK
jgi:hypothetical protein